MRMNVRRRVREALNDGGRLPIKVQIVGHFNITSEDREPALPEHLEPDGALVVIVSVREEEAEGTGFKAGYKREAIAL